MDEAAVATARTVAADLRLEERDLQVGLPFPQGKGRPEAGVAAANDRDVCDCVPRKRRRRRRTTFPGERVLEPPRR